ncbi:MAG: TlpA disulfide reductase family protein [Planctomycetota bacterium]
MSAILTAVLAMLSTMSLSGVAAEHAESASNSTMVEAGAYETADWPAHNRGRLNAMNVQGQKLKVGLGNETWLTEKTELNGKVLVLDFWAVWCPPCRAAEPKLHAVQESHEGSVQVVAISGQNEPQSKVESYIADKSDLNYTHLYDAEQSVYRSLKVRAIPHVVVLSTDGVVRWQGNPHDKAFRTAVDKVVASDPMIRAKSEG